MQKWLKALRSAAVLKELRAELQAEQAFSLPSKGEKWRAIALNSAEDSLSPLFPWQAHTPNPAPWARTHLTA